MSTADLDGYYRDELGYLHELAREFAAEHPDSAHLLADPSSDPDVERLLEGLAFLTARLRGRLDDQMPELTQTLVEGLWPQLLRPVPSACIVAFQPHAAAYQQAVRVEPGSLLEARENQGIRCRFRTARPLTVLPLSVGGVEWRRDLGSELRIRVDCLGAAPAALEHSRLRFYCHGDPDLALALRHACIGLATGVTLVVGDAQHELPADCLQEVGFADDEALLPEADRSLAPLRLLQEYFCYRDAFRFVDCELGAVVETLSQAVPFELRIALSDLPDPAPPVAADNLRLNCVPALNCYEHPADPVRLDARALEYRVHPSHDGRSDPQVYSITDVTATPEGGGAAIELHPSAHRFGGLQEGAWYQPLRRPSVRAQRQELFCSVSVPEELYGRRCILSIDTLCTDGAAAEQVAVGELCVPTASLPPTVRFANLTRPGRERLPPLGADLHWRYATVLDLHHHSIADRSRLVDLLDCYDLPALLDQRERERHQRMCAAIRSFACRPAELHLGGTTVPGLAIAFEAEEGAFGGEGGLHLFACLLDRFCALYASINAATRLEVRALGSGRRWHFPTRCGEAATL